MVKRASFVSIVLAVVCALLSNAHAAGTVAFKSKQPLYAKIAVSGKSVRIVSLALDESKGTGKGYDILYVDSNGNKRFEKAEGIKSKKYPSQSRPSIYWNGVKLPLSGVLRVPLSNGMTANYYGVREKTLNLYASINLPKKVTESTATSYYLTSNLKLNRSLAGAKVYTLAAPSLSVQVQSLDGAVGFAMALKCGDFDLAYTGGPANQSQDQSNASYAIKDDNGGVIESGTGDLQKFGFG